MSELRHVGGGGKHYQCLYVVTVNNPEGTFTYREGRQVQSTSIQILTGESSGPAVSDVRTCVGKYIHSQTLCLHEQHVA